MPKDAAVAHFQDPPAIDRQRNLRVAASSRAETAFRAADLRALRIGYYMRLLALGAIACWLSYLLPFPDVIFFLGCLIAFIALGYAQYRAGADNQGGVLYALILLDFMLLAFVTLTDNPISAEHFPPGQKIAQAREAYFFVLLAGASACYDPRRVLWAGLSAAGAWTLGFFWLTTDPDAKTVFDIEPTASLADWMAITQDPYFVDFNRLVESLIIISIVTCILAVVAHRARRLVRGQIRSTQERANLARYFAPAVVEELASHDTPFDAVRAQSAAVLFADVVGFTKMAQGEPPERIIGFLRALHQRLEQAIFEQDGTLDKYMGDGVMATFGTPAPGPNDACRAIAAARAIQAANAEWNRARADAGYEPALISVGVHYGPVVTGDIGSERRLEFATIGDAVNLASRLESATRRLDASVVVSTDIARQAAAEDPGWAETLLAGFETVPAVDIPGHSSVDVMRLPRQEPGSP